jgi:hypothetical protein
MKYEREDYQKIGKKLKDGIRSPIKGRVNKKKYLPTEKTCCFFFTLNWLPTRS